MQNVFVTINAAVAVWRLRAYACVMICPDAMRITLMPVTTTNAARALQFRRGPNRPSPVKNTVLQTSAMELFGPLRVIRA